jgi:polyhydroxyalkanoate synthesis regulator phasin
METKNIKRNKKHPFITSDMKEFVLKERDIENEFLETLNFYRSDNKEKIQEIIDNVKDRVGELMTKKGDKIIDEIVERNKIPNENQWIITHIPTKEVLKPISTSTQENEELRYISPEELDNFARKLSETISPTYCECQLNKTKKEDTLCENPKTFDELCQGIMDLHRRKNTDYGNAFRELYKKFGPLNYVYPRLYEKLKRVESLLINKGKANTKDGALVADEKISDTLLDIATYCIMTVEEMQY